MRDLELALHMIAKQDGEQQGLGLVDRPQEHLVVIAPRHGEDFVLALRQRIKALYPGARVVVTRFPRGKRGDKLRLLLTVLSEAIGQPPPTRGQTTVELARRLRPAVWQAADFLLIENADLLNLHCFHYLRRDQGMAPTILVGRSKRLLTTLDKDEMILQRALFLDAEAM